MLVKTAINNQSRIYRLSALILSLPIIIIFYKNAWVSDDAYITFRTIDNFCNGYGLTWNTSERVQAYTHPLWMILIAIFTCITKEFYFTVLVISLALYCLIFVSVINFFKYASLSLAFFCISLISSNAWIDFSTSGLENILGYFLLSLFYISLTSSKSKNYFFLLACLVVLTRFDLILIILPSLILNFKSENYPIKRFIVSFLPLIIWLLFSLLYYGSIFPNTAYAKLETGWSWSQKINSAWSYYQVSFEHDPITLTAIFIAIALGIVSKQAKFIALAIGICLYTIYPISAGGDFMRGRFFSYPFIVSIFLISILIGNKRVLLYLIISLILYNLTFKTPIWYRPYSQENTVSKKIVDEKNQYFKYTGFISRGKDLAIHPSWIQGDNFKKSNEPLTFRGTIGIFGFASGPKKYIVDIWALTDPLRSHIIANEHAFIGHFNRKIPDYYPESILNNKNLLIDPSLKQFYDIIRILTRDKIFSFDRMKVIIKYNLGYYNHLIRAYNNDLKVTYLDPQT